MTLKLTPDMNVFQRVSAIEEALILALAGKAEIHQYPDADTDLVPLYADERAEDGFPMLRKINLTRVAVDLERLLS